MKRFNEEIRGRLIGCLIKVVSPQTTIEDLEIVITQMEHIFREEKILR